MTLLGGRTIFNGNQRHPPKENPCLVTVFLQRGHVRYKSHDRFLPDQTTQSKCDWWEDCFRHPESYWGVEPITILYRLRITFQ